MYRASTLLQIDNLFNAITTADIAASTHVIASVLKPRSGLTITHICCYSLSVTAPPIIKASLQTITGTNPSGTDISGAVTTFTPANSTFYELELATPYVVPSPSTPISACLSYSSGTVGASNKVTFYYRATGNRPLTSWARNFTTSWDTTQLTPAIFVKYSDGTYDILDSTCNTTAVGVGIGPALTFDEIGNRLAIPCGYECTGIAFGARLVNTTCEIYPKVISSIRGTLLNDTNLKLTGTQVSTNTSILRGVFEFDPISISPMEQIDFTLKNIGAGSTATINRINALNTSTFQHLLGFKSANASAISVKNNILQSEVSGLYEIIPMVKKLSYEKRSVTLNGGLV